MTLTFHWNGSYQSTGVNILRGALALNRQMQISRIRDAPVDSPLYVEKAT